MYSQMFRKITEYIGSEPWSAYMYSTSNLRLVQNIYRAQYVQTLPSYFTQNKPFPETFIYSHNLHIDLVKCGGK